MLIFFKCWCRRLVKNEKILKNIYSDSRVYYIHDGVFIFRKSVFMIPTPFKLQIYTDIHVYIHCHARFRITNVTIFSAFFFSDNFELSGFFII